MARYTASSSLSKVLCLSQCHLSGEERDGMPGTIDVLLRDCFSVDGLRLQLKGGGKSMDGFHQVSTVTGDKNS